MKFDPEVPQSGLSLVHTDSVTDDVTIETDDTSSETDETTRFVATNEWQPIRPGQVIPAGLHVRLNLKTGEKEAKILENDQDVNDKTQYIDKHKKVGQIVTRESDINKIGQQLKQVLEDSVFAIKSNTSSESNFRSIDEIKKEFNELNIKMSSESELLKTLIEKYNDSSVEEKQTLLTDIEYLVHSLDVARDLVKLGGVPVLVKDLNATESQLRAQIAFTLGSAMNANPRVQIEVLKSGSLKELLRLLQSDVSFEVKKKSLYALSCLVRQFPIAQKSLFTEYGALSIFANFFDQPDIHSMKLSVKIVTLLNDLLIERQMTSKYANNDELSQIKLKQYNDVHLEEAIVSHGFCDLIPKLLDSPDEDIKEKTIEAMNSLSVLCKHQFKKYLNHLQSIKENYEILSKRDTNIDSNDSYFSNLHSLTSKLINNIESKDEL